jgi:hypothetical protein
MTRASALVLLASTLGFGMVLLDTSVVNVAGPVIRDDQPMPGEPPKPPPPPTPVTTTGQGRP